MGCLQWSVLFTPEMEREDYTWRRAKDEVTITDQSLWKMVSFRVKTDNLIEGVNHSILGRRQPITDS